ELPKRWSQPNRFFACAVFQTGSRILQNDPILQCLFKRRANYTERQVVIGGRPFAVMFCEPRLDLRMRDGANRQALHAKPCLPYLGDNGVLICERRSRATQSGLIVVEYLYKGRVALRGIRTLQAFLKDTQLALCEFKIGTA